jgi:beta-glucosidase
MFYTRNQRFHMNQPAYLDSNLPICERVQDLLSRLTLDVKVAMMNHPAQGVPRLNIPAYNYWNEGERSKA